MSQRHTITINDSTYHHLQRIGKFGESYDQLISRLIKSQEMENESGKY